MKVGERIIKSCARCRNGHNVAVHVPEGQEMRKEWKCDRGHHIKNPHATTDCEDFEEKPSLKKL
jgi:hypothetical protein